MECQGPVLLARTRGGCNWHVASHFRSGRPLAYSLATGAHGPKLRASSSLCATMIAAVCGRLGRVGVVPRSGTGKETQGRESYESYEYPALVLTSAFGAVGALGGPSRPKGPTSLVDAEVLFPWLLEACRSGAAPGLAGAGGFLLVEHHTCSEEEVCQSTVWPCAVVFGTAHLQSCCCCPRHSDSSVHSPRGLQADLPLRPGPCLTRRLLVVFVFQRQFARSQAFWGVFVAARRSVVALILGCPRLRLASSFEVLLPASLGERLVTLTAELLGLGPELPPELRSRSGDVVAAACPAGAHFSSVNRNSAEKS